MTTLLPRYEPGPEEIAVVRLSPGERALVATAAGDVEVYGERPGDYAGPVAALVPHHPVAVGWHHETRSFTTSVLRLGLGKHQLDRPIWTRAAQLLAEHGSVYVRITPVDHFGRARLTATAVRLEGAPQ